MDLFWPLNIKHWIMFIIMHSYPILNQIEIITNRNYEWPNGNKRLNLKIDYIWDFFTALTTLLMYLFILFTRCYLFSFLCFIVMLWHWIHGRNMIIKVKNNRKFDFLFNATLGKWVDILIPLCRLHFACLLLFYS